MWRSVSQRVNSQALDTREDSHPQPPYQTVDCGGCLPAWWAYSRVLAILKRLPMDIASIKPSSRPRPRRSPAPLASQSLPAPSSLASAGAAASAAESVRRRRRRPFSVTRRLTVARYW